MKFRKKPVVIDAVQFRSQWKQGAVLFPQWAVQAIANGAIDLDYSPGSALIKTPEGTMTASDCDWIILGVMGEIYPCKPDIFAATYEAAEQPVISTETRLRSALALLVGGDSVAELEGMAAFIAAQNIPEQEKRPMVDAINLLLETAPKA
jgi:hypothetical protein